MCVCKRGVSCTGIHVHPEDEGGRGFILVRERTRTSRMCKKEGKMGIHFVFRWLWMWALQHYTHIPLVCRSQLMNSLNNE